MPTGADVGLRGNAIGRARHAHRRRPSVWHRTAPRVHCCCFLESCPFVQRTRNATHRSPRRVPHRFRHWPTVRREFFPTGSSAPRFCFYRFALGRRSFSSPLSEHELSPPIPFFVSQVRVYYSQCYFLYVPCAIVMLSRDLIELSLRQTTFTSRINSYIAPLQTKFLVSDLFIFF